MGITSISVRLPPELKDKLKAVAKKNKHSMNAEIIQRIEQSFNAIEKPEVNIEQGITLAKKEVAKIKAVLKKAVKALKK